ncbi:MAG: putative toxin-antitoxin system toxin component, PIN family [Burkholderiaceae bacterium]|jgi:putative PIN family toxin of toxin-antitoxin system|nr:putative toxin-antitoxin system toxin component, PIN family [Burkholderiaceae bacterium]
MPPPKLVLDTNVVVSALLWGGMPGQLIGVATEGDAELFTSEALLVELRDVLGRPHLAARLRRHCATAEQALAQYGELARWVQPQTVPRVVPADADDDHVIAAAVAAKADLIVSGDRHLLSLGVHQGIAIVTATQALERIGRAAH